MHVVATSGGDPADAASTSGRDPAYAASTSCGDPADAASNSAGDPADGDLADGDPCITDSRSDGERKLAFSIISMCSCVACLTRSLSGL